MLYLVYKFNNTLKILIIKLPITFEIKKKKNNNCLML